MDHDTHRYHVTCHWRGSTGAGYDNYDRTHHAEAAPARVALELSSDSVFLGRPDLLNPEQLLVVAAASCQLLSFLAVAARARVDVVAYVDEAEAVMPESERPMRITEINLRPRITVRGEVSAERVASLAETAHRECFVANSLNSEVTVTPVVDIVGAGDADPTPDAPELRPRGAGPSRRA